MTDVATQVQADAGVRQVFGGVDTHDQTHTVAAVDAGGRLLGHATLPATPVGYRRLLAWLRACGVVAKVGVEGTGSYGAGLARSLTAAGVVLVEVDRPNRQTRRRLGKSDPADAEAAKETIRCLKRYIARELLPHIRHALQPPQTTP
jgi:transposase